MIDLIKLFPQIIVFSWFNLFSISPGLVVLMILVIILALQMNGREMKQYPLDHEDVVDP